jgi:hypothetical protein
LSGQPDQLNITLALVLKASARRNAIEIAINVYLEPEAASCTAT